MQFSDRASPSTTEEEVELERGRAAPGEGYGSPPTLPLFIGGRGEGAGPLRSYLGGQGGGNLPPKLVGGAPTPRVFNPRRRGRPKEGAPAH